ncbi:inosine-5-monophosphate dehydrogenase [Roseivivax halodurans JCM 10272]|uniref:Inosine-5-monophosphate dehydrogenase n=1 Tax=Roseivivax halodurans JCM 10272 TaxID=1449350 RepID=X7EKP8_9RHOB|nr:CBS domain-containing protein [Roseivivax halodurans]ETX16477.1 inosine-5-monophosphate dehydrogenase [Roseivivax halodurans JCM 10272]
MQVQHILKSKADDGVVSVTPGTLVRDAAKVLAERRIGTVVVSEDGQTAQGILSERDIVRMLAQRGAAVLEAPVEDLMTRDIQTCTRSDAADEVLQRMTEGRFRHMPVIEDGKMVGLVTIGDAVKARLTELAMEKDALEGMITSNW